MISTPSTNFAFLAHHDPRLVALGTQAEEHFALDPTVCIFKLRQFGEVLAKRAAAKVGLFVNPEEGQQALIDRLWERNVIGATQRSLFHDLRRIGNAAVHEGKGDHSEALHQLRMARELAIWFQRSFGNNRKFDPGPFVPPTEPKKAEAALHDELERLRQYVEARAKDLAAARRAIEQAEKAAEAEVTARMTAEERAQRAREEAAIREALASEQMNAERAKTTEEAARNRALEEQNKALLAELTALQAAAQAMPAKQLERAIEQAADASEAIELDEPATRKLIDRQLETPQRRLQHQRRRTARRRQPMGSVPGAVSVHHERSPIPSPAQDQERIASISAKPFSPSRRRSSRVTRRCSSRWRPARARHARASGSAIGSSRLAAFGAFSFSSTATPSAARRPMRSKTCAWRTCRPSRTSST